MRTNIDIDEKLIEEARRITGLASKKAIVEAALEELVRRARQREVADYFGKLPSWEGNLDESRKGRAFD
ncbi:MAG: type II toxin-antitoxin system VapB family antitoxin [Geminicoccaceae bacterium]|jgi:Arc/MetJ family transcription regulator|nr:type II toxin-antitoxin system VapB family antitoxin [Geminicoccaceae bacterium]MCB9967822.1 type II toxin-antitoxin system VapB family antitoxin [Geminicoccaceae bacterium]HRY26400.1 type II toxin-antitoxin system VapB family antitoxin [Geminicoccaceae bacterium]